MLKIQNFRGQLDLEQHNCYSLAWPAKEKKRVISNSAVVAAAVISAADSKYFGEKKSLIGDVSG